MADLDPKTITALIGAVSAIAGAIAGAVAKGYSSRQNLRELEFEYENKLQVGYLEKAREYMESVYVPLSISLSQLNGAYYSYRTDASIKAANIRLRRSIRDFLVVIKELGSRGANAFLTTDLDETLQAFCHFIESSLESKESKIKAILKISIRSIPFMGKLNANHEFMLSGESARKLRTGGKLSFGIGGLGFGYEADEIMSAPLNSAEFEERFIRDIHTINVLIKEVTLGSKARE